MTEEELRALAEDRNFKRGQLILALERLALWQGELALGNYVIIKLKGVK